MKKNAKQHLLPTVATRAILELFTQYMSTTLKIPIGHSGG
jgi:hypothetical protein